MDFDLTADQKLFRATTREFLEKEMPLTRVRELASSGIGFESDWWKRGSELGWNAMTVDPAAGGDRIRIAQPETRANPPQMATSR